MTTADSDAHRPLLGLRRRPGRLALAAMRMPRPLYHHGLGRLLDHVFLLITHVGRTTGKRRETVAMALGYDPKTHAVVVCSAWGPNTEWIRNLHAHPAVQIQIGRESYAPEQQFLSEDEAVAVTIEFRRRHPRRVRLLAAILGWGDLDTEAAVREFVRKRPFVSFRPGQAGESQEVAQPGSTDLGDRGAFGWAVRTWRGGDGRAGARPSTPRRGAHRPGAGPAGAGGRPGSGLASPDGRTARPDRWIQAQ